MEQQYRAVMEELRASDDLRRRVSVIPTQASSRRLPKIAALAAAAAVLLTAGAWAAEAIWGVSLTEMVTGRQESRYEVSWTLEPYPVSAFSENVDDAMEEVRQAFQNRKPYDSWFPGHWQRYFGSWQEGADFLGISVSNPLEGQVWLEPAASTTELLAEKDRRCELNLHGNAKGQLEQASLQTGYRFGGLRVALTVQLFTEYSDQDSMAHIWPEETAYTQDTYRMSDGQEALIITATPSREDSYTAAEAHFLWDGGLYSLRVVGEKGEDQAVRQLLEQVLDCF